MSRVYLDNNATTPVASEVVEAMLPFLTHHFGNASSVHTEGQRARAAVEQGRADTAALIKADPAEIIFTSGGTEADNMALRGIVQTADRPAHIVTSRVEHPAVLRCCEALEAEGHAITYLEVDREGLLEPAALKEALRPDTVLVSIQHANNETGVVQPIAELAEIARDKGAFFHTDAVQTVGKIEVDANLLGVDLLSLSGHKIHGPKGIGALFVRRGVETVPWIRGGSQERKRRAGTENVAAIAGLGRACQLASSVGTVSEAIASRRDRLEQGLLDSVADSFVNGALNRRVPHTSSISFGALDGEALLVALDFEGVAVSTGAACASGSIAPSHVLTAMGLAPERVQSALRFSLSRETSDADVDTVLEVVPRLAQRMREVSSPS